MVVRRKVPSNSFQNKVLKRKFVGKSSQASNPEQTLPSEGSQRKIPNERSQATVFKRNFPRANCKRRLPSKRSQAKIPPNKTSTTIPNQTPNEHINLILDQACMIFRILTIVRFGKDPCVAPLRYSASNSLQNCASLALLFAASSSLSNPRFCGMRTLMRQHSSVAWLFPVLERCP